MSSPYYSYGPTVVQGHAVDERNKNHLTSANVYGGDTGGGGFANALDEPMMQHHGGGGGGGGRRGRYGHNKDTKTSNQGNNDDDGPGKGIHQPPSCRDGFWAVLFYVHMAAIVYCTIMYTPIMVQDVADDYGGGAQRRNLRQYLSWSSSSSSSTWSSSSSSSSLSFGRWLQEEEQGQDGGENAGAYTDDYSNVEFDYDMNALLITLAMAGLAGFVIATLSLTFMMNCAQGLVKMALIFNILICIGLMALSLLTMNLGLLAMSGLGLLVSGYYAYAVWNRIPFAASNLVTALSAVRSNMGLSFFAYNNLIISFLWSILWGIAFVATIYVLGECDAEGNCQKETNPFLVFTFLVSYFWTAQVIKNVVHTTVAGTVGTWWFVPEEASGCCSSAVINSYLRSITTSFGSICLGSLIVALIQATKEIIHALRDDNDSMLLCLAECIVGCIESLVEYFNQWAYVYVGIYGYSFMQAGSSVMTLFRSRGWTAIIADVLVDTVLFMVSIGVGVLNGVLTVFISSLFHFGVDGISMGIAFV